MITKEETFYLNFLLSKQGNTKKEIKKTTENRKQPIKYVRNAVKLDVENVKARIAGKKFY